ncbi:MAG: sulfite exporter TauE/SafE family protein [Bacteroidota bacterium]|nr:sulfite exporter TauE/SafE family protein [Bacteroidota bacterium]
MFFSSLLFGLITSLHCVGMCGPIAMMLPIDRSNWFAKNRQIVLYHLGRLTTYSMLGLVFGLFGRGLYLAGIQQRISILVGVVIIVIAIIPEKVFMKYNFSKPLYKVISEVKSALGNQFKKKTNFSIFTIGLLNGLLPCAMIYVVLFGAIAMQDSLQGMLYMFMFGLGTIPLMSMVIYFSSFVQKVIGNKLSKIIPVVMFILGILFILRGLGLNIPLLSPSELQLFVNETPNC